MGKELDTTANAGMLKRVYGDFTDIFANQKMTYNQFFKTPATPKIRNGGVGYYFGVRQGNYEGIGARGQGQMLPSPLDADSTQGVIGPKAIYGSLRMEGLLIEVGKSDTEAFVNVQSDAVQNMYDAMIVDLNRQCHGDGTGLLATLSTAASAKTGATWTITCDNDRGVRYLKKGMLVDFFESTSIDEDTVTSRIASINPTTKVVTMEANAGTYLSTHPIAAARSYSLDDSQSVASGAFVVRTGARLATHAVTTTYEIAGMNAMFDDGTLLTTFEGINTSNDPEFKANILGNSDVNRELSEDLMLSAMDMTAARSSKTADIIRTGLGQRRKYFGLLKPDLRYAPSTFVGGYENLGFSQNQAVTMVFDPVTQPNRMYFEPKGCIKRYEVIPIGWGGFDPNIMHWRQDYDQAAMYLRTYTNLGVEERNALTLLDDLTEPANTPF